MKILSIYLLSTFYKILALILPVFIALYLVVEFVERIDDFLYDQSTISTILLYLALRVPIVGVQVAPLAVLLSVALTLALFQRSREMIALLAAGSSPWYVIQLFFVGTMLVVAICLGMEEWVLPRAHRALTDLQEDARRFPPQGALIQQGEIWFRGPDATYVHIELVDPAAERIHGVTIFRRDTDGELIEQIQAREAVWLADQWTLLHGTTTRFQGSFPARVTNFSRLELPLGMEPEALRSMFTAPSQMSLSELQSYMRRLRDRGVDMTVYARDFQVKLANPLMGLIMVIVGLAAMWGTHDARYISLGFVGTLCGAGTYWLLVMVGTALSGSQHLPLLLGIWLPHLIVLGLSGFIFWRRALA